MEDGYAALAVQERALRMVLRPTQKVIAPTNVIRMGNVQTEPEVEDIKSPNIQKMPMIVASAPYIFAALPSSPVRPRFSAIILLVRAGGIMFNH